MEYTLTENQEKIVRDALKTLQHIRRTYPRFLKDIKQSIADLNLSLKEAVEYNFRELIESEIKHEWHGKDCSSYAFRSVGVFKKRAIINLAYSKITFHFFDSGGELEKEITDFSELENIIMAYVYENLTRAFDE